jgi:hypothetical protein
MREGICFYRVNISIISYKHQRERLFIQIRNNTPNVIHGLCEVDVINNYFNNKTDKFVVSMSRLMTNYHISLKWVFPICV